MKDIAFNCPADSLDTLVSTALRDQVIDNGPPFVFKFTIRNLTLGPPVPVSGIGEVAFLAVQIGVHPRSVCAAFLLHDLMRTVPVTVRVLPQRLQKRRQIRFRFPPL